MKIEVRSRKNASVFTSQVPWAVISIATKPEWPEFSKENLVGVLPLCFKDTTHLVEGHFTKDQAQQILDFTRDIWGKAECILVHCDAGLSRSPAVAASISHIFIGEGEDKYYFDHYWPNYLVYKTIMEAHYGPIAGASLQQQRDEIVLDKWEPCTLDRFEPDSYDPATCRSGSL